jgi:inositol-hexakisphosphate/diphosphoinositol-pentakisphosphate 1-kinase
MASRVSRGFGQRICGFDLLRANGKSYVIDVNGWSFVKDNQDYYNECAKILRIIFSHEKYKRDALSNGEISTEPTFDAPTRRETTGATGHTHRNALKTIFKSPSITKLSAHLPHPHKHHGQIQGTRSPRSSMTAPLSSPPTVEKPGSTASPMIGSVIPAKAAELEDVLPPSTMSGPDAGAEDAVEESSAVAVEENVQPDPPLPNSKHSWKLKGLVSVIRHADRTPKQKLKFTAHSQLFVDLLKGHHEEVLLKGEAALTSVETAVKMAQRENLEDPQKLRVRCFPSNCSFDR